jgi:Flp pilus assembly protein CpaB
VQDIANSKRFTILAIALALAGAVVVWIFCSVMQNSYQDDSELVAVLRAPRYLPAGTAVQPEDFVQVQLPRKFIEPDAISEFTTLLSSGTSLFRTRIAIPSDAQLVLRDLLPTSQADSLSQVIPEDQVAVSFGVDGVRGLAGNVRIGDVIDILQTSKPQRSGEKPTTRLLFQAVRVVAVGTQWREKMGTKQLPGEQSLSSEPESDTPIILTVLLNPLTAVRMAEARESDILSAILRSPGDMRTLPVTP